MGDDAVSALEFDKHGIPFVGGALGPAVVSGGTHTSDADFDYYAFTTAGADTLTVTRAGLVDVLLVGGGSGGGGNTSTTGNVGGDGADGIVVVRVAK